jgi:hypothetical protein
LLNLLTPPIIEAISVWLLAETQPDTLNPKPHKPPCLDTHLYRRGSISIVAMVPGVATYVKISHQHYMAPTCCQRLKMDLKGREEV